MGERLKGRSWRAALGLLVLLALPILGFGGGPYTINSFTVKWVAADGTSKEITSSGELKSTYGYEVRVAIGKQGSYREVGSFRETRGDRADDFQTPSGSAAVQYHAFGKEYREGDEIQLRWYDHVYNSVKRSKNNIKDLLYPSKVDVVVKDGGGKELYKETVFDLGGSGGGAAAAEVRIPWQYSKVTAADADAPIFTALNKSGKEANVNPSFVLPIPKGGGKDIKIELAIGMSHKTVRSLEFAENSNGKSFDGSARVRMKSPGDKGFWNHSVKRIGESPSGSAFGQFFDAYPYPNTDGKIEIKKNMLVEGWILVVEARNVAKDGVCVGGMYGGRKVQIKQPVKSGTSMGAAKNGKCSASEPNWDGYSGEYWFVPLWVDGADLDAIKVMPGPCPGAMLEVEYSATGDGYKDLKLFKDEECLQSVPSGSKVESGRTLYATLMPEGGSGCKEIKLLWSVDGKPVEGNECNVVEKGKKYSFVPQGKQDKKVKVWGKTETKKITLSYEAAGYEIKHGANLLSKGAQVDCGARVTIRRESKAGDPGCMASVDVYVNGDKKGTITWSGSGWTPCEVEVEGDADSKAAFIFQEIVRQYTAKWSDQPGKYKLHVYKGPENSEEEVTNGSQVGCGSRVRILVELDAAMAGRPVRGITAKDDNQNEIHGTFDGGSTLIIDALSKSIDAVEVELGADPKGLTVIVDESAGGVKLVDVEVVNATQGTTIWQGGKYGAGDGRFAEGDDLEVKFNGVETCYSDVVVEVRKRNTNKDLIAELQVGKSCTINGAREGVDVTVKQGWKKKQFEVEWQNATPPNFKVQQGGKALVSGAMADCGSSIEIVPELGGCKGVQEVKVNDKTVSKNTDGKYILELQEAISKIEVTDQDKTLTVEWGSLPVEVKVNGNGTSPVSVKCGDILRLTLEPDKAAGSVLEVVLEEEGKSSVTLKKGGAPSGYTWEVDANSGAVTITWTPTGNVKIAKVVLPSMCKITYAKDLDRYTVSVAKRGAPNAALKEPIEVPSGTELLVTVKVANPAQYKVEKVNCGDAAVAEGTKKGPVEYSYTFTVKADTEIVVVLAGQKYKVEYSPAGGDVAVKEVWQNGKGNAGGGEVVATGGEVNYATILYVRAEAAKTSAAVQGVEKVEVRYKGGTLVELISEGEGWYRLKDGVVKEVEEIVVTVQKLAPGEVFVVYGGETKGAEEFSPYGQAKGAVRWSCGGRPLEAGKRNKVRVSDAFKWELVSANGVSLDDLVPMCLTVNRQYAWPFTGGEKRKEFTSMEEFLPAPIKEAVGRQAITELRLDTYISLSQSAMEYLVLYVQDPKPLGDLEVIVKGGSTGLNYGESYLLTGGGTLRVKAKAHPPVQLQRAFLGEQDLGLTLEEEKEVQLPAYDKASATGNRLTIGAIFTQAAHDECLLTLNVNDAAGGELTVWRGTERLESGKYYQRAVRVSVKVQARPGYFLQQVEQNGLKVYENAQRDTLVQSHQYELDLPATAATIVAYFEKSSRRKPQPSAVDEAIWQGVSMYPNPSDGEVHVDGASVVSRYAVYDVAGREVIRGEHDGSVAFSIDFRALSSGYYIVRLYSLEGETMSRGVIRR